AARSRSSSNSSAASAGRQRRGGGPGAGGAAGAPLRLATTGAATPRAPSPAREGARPLVRWLVPRRHAFGRARPGVLLPVPRPCVVAGVVIRTTKRRFALSTGLH